MNEYDSHHIQIEINIHHLKIKTEQGDKCIFSVMHKQNVQKSMQIVV
jgi:hypothetical protein